MNLLFVSIWGMESTEGLCRRVLMQFYGTYNHKIDAKGRVSLPAKFRRAYERAQASGEIDTIDLVAKLSPSKDCLYVFTSDDFDDWVFDIFDAQGGFNPRSKKDEILMRALRGANVESVEIDSAGRVNLSPKLRESAGLSGEVSFVGNSGRFEIWNPQALTSQMEDVDLESLLYTV